MSVDWMDSVAHYDGDTALSKWTILEIFSSVVAAAGPRGNQVLCPGNGAGITRAHTSHFIWGFRFKNNETTASTSTIYRFQHVSTELGFLKVESDQTLSIYAGSGTLIANSAQTNPPFKIQPLIWYYFEIEVSLSGSTPINVEINFRVNGQQIMSGTKSSGLNVSQLLLQEATANYHQFIALGAQNSSFICDLLFINVAENSGVTTFQGDVEISAVYPDSDVTTEWDATGTPQYKQVNEAPPDGDTTYISTNTKDDLDEFLFQPIPTFIGTIVGIHYLAYARKDDEGDKTFTLTVEGTQPSGMPTFAPSDEYVYFTYAMDLNPSTGNAWTVDEFNATDFGIKLLS